MAAGATYEPIATSSPSGTNTVTFSSLGFYTDIRVVCFGQESGGDSLCLRFNGDTATNYSRVRLYGDGTTATSGLNTSQTSINLSVIGTSPNWTLSTFDVFSYGGSTNKTVLATQSADFNGSGTVNRTVGLWRSTAAITSITVFLNGANTFSSGTNITIYGIKAA